MVSNCFPPKYSSDSGCCLELDDGVPTTGSVPGVTCSTTMRVPQQHGSSRRHHQITGCFRKNKAICMSCATEINSLYENARWRLIMSVQDSRWTSDFLSKVLGTFRINIAKGIAGYVAVIVFVTCMSLTSAQSCSSSNSTHVVECNCSTESTAVNTCDLTNVTTDLCGGIICRNNASCDVAVNVNASNGNQVVNCTCNHGYTGEFCESLIDFCANVSCQNGGRCSSDQFNFTFKCICQQGWTGVHCDQKIPCNETTDSCNSIIAQDCKEGFEGVNCSTPNCSLVNCTNEGKCSIEGVQWFCNCTAFYKGTNCELSVNKCDAGDVCKNNGSCHNFDGGYNCTCLDGYSGHDCDFYDVCSSNPCYHNGICSNASDNSYVCSCRPGSGYYGERCEFLDECSAKPCLNNGMCHNFTDNYNCSCLPGFQGVNCSEIDSCHSSPCNNNGTCRNSGDDTYSCACLSGYRGTHCEIVVCPLDYTGVHCETLMTLNDGNNKSQVGLIVGLTVGLFFLVVIIVVAVVLIVIIMQKRKNLGTYHPNRQELAGARVDFNNELKLPPEERLI